MTTRRVFIDSNVLIYTVSRGVDEPKRLKALDVLLELLDPNAGVISPQVIGEFMSACSRASFPWASAAEVLGQAAGWIEEFEIAQLDAVTTTQALRVADRYQLHYYDAQIWAAARMSGCDIILTEDTHGDEIEGVRYVNPFEPGFDLEALLAGQAG
jgi:predicted nucleic acid-binding protein